MTPSRVGLDIFRLDIIKVNEYTLHLGCGVESGLVMSDVQNTLEVSQISICKFSGFHMKIFWVEISDDG
jgi:hypothetical protein